MTDKHKQRAEEVLAAWRAGGSYCPWRAGGSYCPRCSAQHEYLEKRIALALSEAVAEERETSRICEKCGLRVDPHRCNETEGF